MWCFATQALEAGAAEHGRRSQPGATTQNESACAGRTRMACHGATTLILRRGRRSIVNEPDVVHNLSCASGHETETCNYSLATIDFDQASFQESVRLMAKSSVLVGVHGAGLTNLIFTPPGAAVVELLLAHSRPDYLQLSRSFGKMYIEYSETIMVVPPSTSS